jgi:hypothetical protein
MNTGLRCAFYIGVFLIGSNALCFAIDQEQQYMPTLRCFQKLDELKPWFEQIRSSIADSPRNKEKLESLRQKLPNHTPVSLQLGLTMGGQLNRLSVRQSSGIQEEDKIALDIVSQSAPFISPPNDLIEQGVLMKVKFLKVDENLNIQIYALLPPDFPKPTPAKAIHKAELCSPPERIPENN